MKLSRFFLTTALVLSSAFSFAQTAATATASASVKSTAGDARDAVRAAKDSVDEAYASISLEKKAISAAQKAVPDLAAPDRPAAQKAVDERMAALAIAEKRLAQVADRCTVPTVTTVSKKTSVATSHVSSVTHENAALKARIIALEQKQSATAIATATASANAEATGATATASASASASASATASAVLPAAGQPVATGVKHTCNLFVNDKLIVDFLVKNPYGAVIAPEGQGPQCRAAQNRYKADHPEIKWVN
jgi:hypothetical protein